MAINNTKYFVFLEICDADISDFLNSLRTIFNRKEFKSNIHVTLRGPYSKPVDEEKLGDWYRKISTSTILIANPGIFKNEGESIVYLRVSMANNSKNLSRITRKFDFPKNKFDFNPHITLYAGNDSGLAQRIYEFMRKEKIEFVCHSFELSVYASNPQRDLFPTQAPSMRGSISNLIFTGKVSPEIFVRARRLVESNSSE